MSFTRSNSFQLHPNDYQWRTSRPPGSQLSRWGLQKGWCLRCPGAAEGLEQSQGCPAQPMAWSPGAQEGRPATPSPWRPPSKNTAWGCSPRPHAGTSAGDHRAAWGVGGWGRLAQERTGAPLTAAPSPACAPRVPLPQHRPVFPLVSLGWRPGLHPQEAAGHRCPSPVTHTTFFPPWAPGTRMAQGWQCSSSGQGLVLVKSVTRRRKLGFIEHL